MEVSLHRLGTVHLDVLLLHDVEFVPLPQIWVETLPAVPARKLHPGNDLSYDQLALVEILAIGCHAVQRVNPALGSTVLVIDASGNPRAMSTCFQYAAFTERVVYVGITTSDLTFPHAPVFHRRELTLLASRIAMPADFTRIIQLIREGGINTTPWITHRMRFDEVPSRFASITDPALGAVKVIIDVR